MPELYKQTIYLRIATSLVRVINSFLCNMHAYIDHSNYKRHYESIIFLIVYNNESFDISDQLVCRNCKQTSLRQTDKLVREREIVINDSLLYKLSGLCHD